MSFGFEEDNNDYYNHASLNHSSGIDKEEISENETRMRAIITEFLSGDVNVYQLKAALNMLEKDELDLV